MLWNQCKRPLKGVNWWSTWMEEEKFFTKLITTCVSPIIKRCEEWKHHFWDDKFLQVRSFIIGGVVFKTILATRRSPSKQKHRSPSPINVAACNWWGWFSRYKSLWEKHLVGYNNKRKYLVLLRAEFWVLFQGINHDCWSQSPKKKKIIIILNKSKKK
jgi:hypothetical protein